MVVATLGIALPEVRQSLSLSEIAGGGLFSILFIVAAVSSTIAGGLADRIGRKSVLITGLAALAAGFALAGTAGNLAALRFFLGLTGLGYGFITPSLYAIMSDLLPQRRGLGASLVSVSYGIGGAIGALLASRVIAGWGWRPAFVAVGAIAAVIMALELYWIENSNGRHPSSRSGYFRRTLSVPLLLLCLAELVGGSVFWSAAAWTATLLRTAKALSLQQTGWIMSVWSLSQMIGAMSLGLLSDKLGRKRVILISAFPAAAASFVAFYWLESPAALGFGFFVFGTLKASIPALVVTLAQEASPGESAGTASGIIMSLHYTAAVLAPLLAAQLIAGTGDIVLAMILASSIPMVVYGCLIAAVRERA